MAKKRKEGRKGGKKQHTFKTQTDAQDVQGQSPWQQDSLFITSMKLEGKEHDCGALVTAVDMCNYRQITYTYTHTHTVCAFRVAVMRASEGKHSRNRRRSLHSRPLLCLEEQVAAQQ